MADLHEFSSSSRRTRGLGGLFAIVFAFAFLCWGCTNPPGTAPTRANEATAAQSAIERPPLRIGTSGDYRPFSVWRADEAQPTGFSIDVARAFAREQGRAVEWIRFRWPELLDDLAADRFDLALSGVTVRSDRSKVARFSLPITTSQALVLTRAGGRFDRAEPIDLDRPEVRLAVNAGGHLERVARRAFPNARILPIEPNHAVLDSLARREVDGVVTDSLEAPHWQARLQGLTRIGPLTNDFKAGLIGPQRTDLAALFDAWLLSAEAKGTLAVLRARHGLPDTRTAQPELALLASLDERLALMPDVARAKAILGKPIFDPARERLVIGSALAKVAERASAFSSSAPDRDATEALFRAQIEAAKWIQRNTTVDRSGPSNEAGEWRARLELEKILRPALIRIGDRIAFLVAASVPKEPKEPEKPEGTAPTAIESPEADRQDEARYALLRTVLARHGLPEPSLRALHEALVGLRRPRAAPGREPEAVPSP